jgi:hypothetical protein
MLAGSLTRVLGGALGAPGAGFTKTKKECLGRQVKSSKAGDLSRIEPLEYHVVSTYHSKLENGAS